MGFFFGAGSITDMGERYPVLDHYFQSSIPGLYIVGNVACQPDIKAALNSGFTAAHHLLARESACPGCRYDAVIVGGGPAGMNAALELLKGGRRVLLLERKRLLSTITAFATNLRLYLGKTGDPDVRGDLPFEDTTAGELLALWDPMLERVRPHVREGTEVTNLFRRGHAFEVHTPGAVFVAHRVILASGRLVTLDKIAIAEETRPRVYYETPPAAAVAGKYVLVTGCTPPAARTALELSHATHVTLIHEEADLCGLDPGLAEEIALAERGGRVSVLPRTILRRIESGHAVIQQYGRDQRLENDIVVAFTPVVKSRVTGTEPDDSLIRKAGVRLENTWNWRRALALAATFLATAAFYTVKKVRPDLVTVGGRDLGGWYPFLYSAVVVWFGVKAIRRWRDPLQTKKYVSLIVSQIVLYCVLPELILRNWMAYSIGYPWPLSLNPVTVQSFLEEPARFYLLWTLGLTLIALPLAVMFTGKQYCAWVCGCGGLAETLGDRWRHYSPKGPANIKRERAMWWVTGFAGLLTLLAANGVTAQTGFFSLPWLYGWTVDFVLIAVIPVTLYPFLGGKVWCRYWCPTAGVMHLLSGWFTKRGISRYRILPAKERCIACNMCTRYCEVGIDVKRFALRGEILTNLNSSCIGCGICISVCPTDTLALFPKYDSQRTLLRAERPKPETNLLDAVILRRASLTTSVSVGTSGAAPLRRAGP